MHTIVIGLGNRLMTDEGVGPAVLDRLAAAALPPDTELADLGTAGFALLHALPGHERAIILDCAFMQAPAGALRRFTPDQVRSARITTAGCAHDGDLLTTLALSRRLGECPDDVVILGIQPAAIAPGMHLTEELESRVDDYVRILLAELNGGNSHRRN